ncbi:helix-turn-helix transcriptional regulator [Lactiplantibacillus paraxiangfangensis]|uniref:helix-turn-helix domain-containing protein n=1 Tax=Lactiplantibacillus paraxiangfangensis TaxID=3076224 RepID=UPI0030C75018
MNNRIAKLRKKNGWTLKELSKQLDICDSTLSQYETGKRNPNINIFIKMANIFGVSMDYLAMNNNTPNL